MARLSKIDLGGETVKLLVPQRPKSSGHWTIAAAPVRYHPELGETEEDARAFADAMVESLRAHGRAEDARPAPNGHDHTQCGTDARTGAPWPCPELGARGRVGPSAVSRIRSDDGLALQALRFAETPREERRASAGRLLARVLAERDAKRAAERAAEIAQLLASSGPAAESWDAKSARRETLPVRYATVNGRTEPAPAESIAEPAEPGTAEERAAAFIAEHPMHDYAAVLGAIERADAYAAPGGGAGSLAPLTMQSAAGSHSPSRCAAARERDDIGGWHAGWGLCRDMTAAAEPIADAPAAEPAPTVVDYSAPMPAGFTADLSYADAVARMRAEPAPVAAEPVAAEPEPEPVKPWIVRTLGRAPEAFASCNGCDMRPMVGPEHPGYAAGYCAECYADATAPEPAAEPGPPEPEPSATPAEEPAPVRTTARKRRARRVSPAVRASRRRELASYEERAERPMPRPTCLVCASRGATVYAEDHTAGHYVPAAERAPEPVAEPEPTYTAPVAVPSAAPSSGRPTCPRCGQTFRKSGNGYAWHVANRPDCAESRSAAAA